MTKTFGQHTCTQTHAHAHIQDTHTHVHTPLPMTHLIRQPFLLFPCLTEKAPSQRGIPDEDKSHHHHHQQQQPHPPQHTCTGPIRGGEGVGLIHMHAEGSNIEAETAQGSYPVSPPPSPKVASQVYRVLLTPSTVIVKLSRIGVACMALH